MQTQFDGIAQSAVRIQDALRVVECSRIDVGADELPAILAVADERIDAVGAGADVEHPDGFAARDDAAVAGSQQIGEVVEIVGPAGDGRAEILRRNIPAGDAVCLFQQRAVERFDRRRVGESDGLIAILIRRDKCRQLRAAGDELPEVVTAPMRIARM